MKNVKMYMVKRRVERKGDGSKEVWGWGEKEMSKEDMDEEKVIKKKIK